MRHPEMPEEGQMIINPFIDFRDKSIAQAKLRGNMSPSWEDVLFVASEHPLTTKELRAQGVSVGGLRKDLRYTTYFGKPEKYDNNQGQASRHAKLSVEASERLMEHMFKTEREMEFATRPFSREVCREFLSLIHEHLFDQRRSLSQSEDTTRLQTELLLNSIQDFESRQGFFQRHSDKADQDSSDIGRSKVREFVHFVERRINPPNTPDDPLQVMDSHRFADGISPYQFTEIIKENLDPFSEYLLYRNGLLAPEEYRFDAKMPHPVTVEHGLEALDFAEDARVYDVKPSHLLPGLIEDNSVAGIILDLDEKQRSGERNRRDYEMDHYWGMGRDLIKLGRAVRTQIIPDNEGERFRQSLKVSSEIINFLNQTDGLVAKGPEELASARMFGELLRDSEIIGILVKAGIGKAQLRKWPSILRSLTEQKKSRKKKVKEKEKSEFKVSDAELSKLIDDNTSDRTKLAKDGSLDPVIGRDEELNQILTILIQRGRKNPLILGETGVGKSALFDGLAQLIASGKAPRQLIGARVLTLDLHKMNSGAMFRGSFEAKLLPLLEGIEERNARKESPPIILCIDELHSSLSAGSAHETAGAGQLLKTHLTRGDLYVLGATTQAEFAKHIQPDAALSRRFQAVFLEPPNQENTVKIISGLKDRFISHHEEIAIADNLFPAIIALSNRYLTNQQQPDKALQILDSACARARMEGRKELTLDIVIDTISKEAMVPSDLLKTSETDKYLSLREKLPEQVIGQEQATSDIASALIIANAGLQDPRRPIGSYLLLGPTGVGKTETGKALARILMDDERALVRIDMSNYMEKHMVARLIGAPPGYVGYGEEGTLTGAVRRKPHSVLMLDEIDKAHPDVLNILLPVLDEGELTDGRGQTTNFRNTILLLSCNIGAKSAIQTAKDMGVDIRDGQKWDAVTRPIFDEAVKNHLTPEFINRLDGKYIYKPHTAENIARLVDREIGAVSARSLERWNAGIKINDDIRDQLAKLGYDPEYGARPLKRAVRDAVSKPLSLRLLEGGNKILPGTTIELTGIGDQFGMNLLLAA